MYRIGSGYDVHRLTSGRRLVLCGEHIEHTLGLDGHSDADVAAHALMDALLGALALGDIGKHFPDSDAEYKNADSMELLSHVYKLIQQHNYQLVNADITIIAQQPKIAPFITKMRSNIAERLGCELDAVSVKATTTEKLGFAGRGEGIAAEAVVLLKKGC